VTHVKRTKVLKLRVRGANHPIEVAISEATWNGLHAEDWELRARKFAGLASQVRNKLIATEHYDPGFLSEKDLDILEVRPVRGAPAIEPEPF
jgi:hypothetical protein